MTKYLTIFALLFVFSCEKQQFNVSSKNKFAEVTIAPTYEEWDNLFFWGLTPTAKHDATAMCSGAEVEMVGTKKSFSQSLLGVITYGIYSPRTYQVQCSKK